MKRATISQIKQESKKFLKLVKKRTFLLGFVPLVIGLILTVAEFLLRDLCNIPNIVNGKLNLSVYSLVISVVFLVCRWLLISPLTLGWLRAVTLEYDKNKISDVLLYYYTNISGLVRCLFFNVKINFFVISLAVAVFFPSAMMFRINDGNSIWMNVLIIGLFVLGALAFTFMSAVDIWYMWEFLKGSKNPVKATKKALKGKLSKLFMLNLSFIPMKLLWWLVLPRVYILPRILTCVKAIDQDNNHPQPL